MKINLIKDFSKITYLKLEKEFLNYLLKKALETTRNKKVLISKLQIKSCPIYHHVKRKQFIKFNLLTNLSQITKISLKNILKNVEEIKFSANSAPLKMKNPSFLVNFDTFWGGKATAAFLADGYISTNGDLGYVNKNPKLREEFLKALNKLFHNIKLPKPIGLHQNKDLQLPTIFRPIFNKIGVPTGRKVFINPGVPYWILKSKNLKTLKGYIQQFFDDEGHISVGKRMIDLPQSVDVSKSRVVPKQLLGLRYLLKKFNIVANKPYLTRKYLVRKGNKAYHREKWQLTISSARELKKFNGKIKFISSKKQRRLEKLLLTTRVFQRKNHEIEKEAIQACGLIQNKVGYITSESLRKEIKIGQRYAIKILKMLYLKRKLEMIEERKYVHDNNHLYIPMVYNKYKIKENIC